MYRARVLRMLAPVLVTSALAAAAFCGELVVEQWERGLNRRQPPIKVMDAIGRPAAE